MAFRDSDRPKQASLVKIRLIIAVLAVLCPVVCYISRQNLSIAITAMIVDPQISKFHQNKTTSVNNTQQQAAEVCPIPMGDDGKAQPAAQTYGPKYDWSSSDQSLLFESFFIMYVVFQIPAGRLAEIVGPTYIFQTATLGSAFLTALIPLAASIHPWLFALMRALMGVCQAAMYPACYVLFSRWLPAAERAQAIPMLMAGAFIGSIIASTGTGLLSEQSAFGWEYSFYFASAVCASWSLLWFFLGADQPRQHKLVSLEEIEYIESQLDIRQPTLGGKSELEGEEEEERKRKPSWLKILESPVVWAMNASFFASDWAFSITLLLLPRYLSDILHITPLKNGIINSIIYGLFIVTAPVYGLLSSFLIERGVFGFSCLTYRKIFQSIALFSQTICFALIVLFGCDTYLVLTTLYIQVILYSFNNVGEVLIPSDLSAHFSGTLYAIANTVGSSTGFIIPRVQTFLVPNTKIKSDWEMFFYLSSAITLVGGLIFVLFGDNHPKDFSQDPAAGQRVDSFSLSCGDDCFVDTTKRAAKTGNSGGKAGDKVKQIVI